MVIIGAFRAIAFQQARIPLIKFRKGSPPAGHSSGGGGGAASQPSAGGGRAAPAADVIQELPARFKRPPISQEECDYINRGGPA